jgi:KUP system potassium uptake protein
MGPFFIVDTAFLVSNLMSILDSGWVPLAFAALTSIVMYTWYRGTQLLSRKMLREEIPLKDLVRMLDKKPPMWVPGTAVFLTSHPDNAPEALLNLLKHFKVMYEHNVVLTVVTAHTPRVALEDRVNIEPIGTNSFSRVTLRFGYMESANIPRALAIARKLGWQFDIMSTSFLLTRRLFNEAAKSEMPGWQVRLFIVLARNIAADAASYFRIPTARVIEIGIHALI